MAFKRFAFMGLLAAMLVGLSVAPATALPDIPGLTDCRFEPVPEFPGQGISGSIVPAPTDISSIPEGDPFKEGGPSLYEVYGLSGFAFHNYDLGCNPVDTAIPAFSTWTANFLQVSIAEFILAVNARMANIAYVPTWLDVLDNPVEAISKGLYDGLFTPLAPLALLLCALAVVLALRKARTGKAVVVLVLVAISISLAYAASSIPMKVAQISDGIIPEVSGGISRGINEATGNLDLGTETNRPDVAAIAPFVDNVLYPRWLEGTLGCSDCPVADEYGPDLFRATALTWAEQETYNEDPKGAGAEMIEAKQKLWAETYDKIKEEYPSNAEYLVGRKGMDRVGSASMSFMAIAIPSAFLFISFALMISAFLIWRLLVMTAPAWAIMGLIPATQTILPNIGRIGLASIINAIVFAVIAAVETTLAALLLSPSLGINYLVGIALLVAITILLWFMSKPWRKLTQMARPDPIGSMYQSVNMTKKFASRAAASLVGNRLADRWQQRDHEHEYRKPFKEEPVISLIDRSSEGLYRHTEPLSPDPIATAPTPAPSGSGGGGLPSPDTAGGLPSPKAPGLPAGRDNYVAYVDRPDGTAEEPLEGRILGDDESIPERTEFLVYDTQEGYRMAEPEIPAVDPEMIPENNRDQN